MSVTESSAAPAGGGGGNQPATNKKSKQIIVLSDGTGNSAAAVWRTNVWRVFESLDLSDPNRIAIYDDGVGSSSFKPLAVVTGAVGYGLKRNVIHIYSFLCRNYKKTEDPQIYMFGFSRGAYTIRVLIGLIHSQGLVPFDPSTSEAQLRRDAKAAYRAYRRQRYSTNLNFIVNLFRSARDFVIEGLKRDDEKYNRPGLAKKAKPEIRFVGLWDTVAAYGLPMEEMTRGIDLWLWPLGLPDRQFCPIVQRACHALSLDDERTTFHPVLWSERKLPTEAPPPAAPFRPDEKDRRYIENERLSQVWFSGVHANVGGGYPDDSLAGVPFYWIMSEAKKAGLVFKTDPPADPDALKRAQSSRDQDGRLYDSRSGLASYYRYGPRKMIDLCHAQYSDVEADEVTIAEPKIHHSVFDRIKSGAHGYATIVLPARYAVVTPDGEILSPAANPFEKADLADKRAGQDPTAPISTHDYWKTFRCPRCLIFYAALAALLYFPLFPVFYGTGNPAEGWPRFIPSGLRKILPDFPLTWLNAYAAHPKGFIAGLVLLAIFGGLSVWYARKPGRILPKLRPGAQDDIWNLVWRRRIAYFATLGVSAYLVAFPFVHQSEEGEYSSRFSFLSPIIRLAGSVLPGFLSTWIDSFAANPGWFCLGTLGVVWLMWRGASISTRITDEMRKIWSAVLISRTAPKAANVNSRVFRLRTDECYRTFIWTMKRYFLPSVFAALFTYLGVVAFSRVIFTVADSFGFICREDRPRTAEFETNSLCWLSGDEELEANKRYRITITIAPSVPWRDGTIVTDFGGYGSEKMTMLKYFALPLRRSLPQPWFKPIARIGATGGDEYALDSVRPVGKDVLRRELVAEITARTKGKLFLYVNDAVGLLGWFDLFYVTWGPNSGKANVKVEPVLTGEAPK
jgi:uncharacterized protein (DUF2235 family)